MVYQDVMRTSDLKGTLPHKTPMPSNPCLRVGCVLFLSLQAKFLSLRSAETSPTGLF